MNKLVRYLFTPPAVYKYGDQMSTAARRRVTTDLVFAGIVISALSIYNTILQIRLSDLEFTNFSQDLAHKRQNLFVDRHHRLGGSDHDDSIPLHPADTIHGHPPLDITDCDPVVRPCFRRITDGEISYCNKHLRQRLDPDTQSTASEQ